LPRHRVGGGRLGFRFCTLASRRALQRLGADARDHLLGVEEVEHVGEIRHQQQHAARRHDDRRRDRRLRDVIAAHREADPQRLDAGDDEEPHDAQVDAIAEEQIRDARRVAGRRQLHDDGDDRDGDAQHGGDHLRQAAERVLHRLGVVVDELAERTRAAVALAVDHEVVEQPDRRERGDRKRGEKTQRHQRAAARPRDRHGRHSNLGGC
jgi:hypothetical protein